MDSSWTKVWFLLASVIVLLLLVLLLARSRWFSSKSKEPLSIRFTVGLSVVAAVIGIFGGVPGIIQTFFNAPGISVNAFLPAVIYDDGYDVNSKLPKFSLGGLVRIYNPDDRDIVVTEMRLDGKTQDTSKEWKSPNGKPILYELHVSGSVDGKDTLIKAHSSSVLKFYFAHFENTEGPEIIHSPMKGGKTEDGQLLFTIYVPSFNQLFVYSKERIPSIILDERHNAKLTFSVLFNNERLEVKRLLTLRHFSKQQWGDEKHLLEMYNSALSLDQS